MRHPTTSALTFAALALIGSFGLHCAQGDSAPSRGFGSRGGAAGATSNGDGGQAGVTNGGGGNTAAPGGGNGGGTSGSGGSSTGGQTSGSCANPEEKRCDGVCTPINVDTNCGDCGVKCSAGSVCEQVGNVWDCACPANTVRCGGACVDPKTSNTHCGASGNCLADNAGLNCGPVGACVDGKCGCDSAHAFCGDSCVDTSSNTQYCSKDPTKCGVACKTNAVCVSGGCACPSGTNECSAGCFDFQTDEAACGGCAETDAKNVCNTAKGFECRAGTCQCPVGFELCNGKCVDINNDPDNCGGCQGSPNALLCGWVNQPAGIRQGCFVSGGVPACVSGPCDQKVVGTQCDGVTIKRKDRCYTSDPQFKAGGLMCDDQNSNNIAKGAGLCYELFDDPNFEEFRCWWSGRTMSVNGQSMGACPNDGNTFQKLPPARAGGYCVVFSPSTRDGAGTDGFAIGRR